MTFAADSYPAYSQLESEWLPRLPAHWEEARLSHVADAWPSNVDKHTVDHEAPVRLCNYTDVYKNDRITSSLTFMRATATTEQRQRFRLRRGDTLITKDSETADDIGVPAYVDYEAEDLVCGYHLAIVRPDPSVVEPRYLYWALKSMPTSRQWQVLAAGVTRVGIRSSDLRKVLIPRPPMSEQADIANFLDSETAKIDALVSKQEKLVATLAERRVSLLEDAFRDVPGDRVRLRYLFRPSAECNRPQEQVLSVYRDHGVVLKSSRTDNFNRTPENVQRYLLVRSGDLVVNRMKAWQGSLGVSAHRGIVSGDYEVLRPQGDRLLPEYVHLFLRSPRMVGQYKMRSTGIRPSQWRLYWDEMGDIAIPVPQLSDQRRLCAQVVGGTERIEATIAGSERLVQLATERRAALITAAVTGQIDVRGAA